MPKRIHRVFFTAFSRSANVAGFLLFLSSSITQRLFCILKKNGCANVHIFNRFRQAASQKATSNKFFRHQLYFGKQRLNAFLSPTKIGQYFFIATTTANNVADTKKKTIKKLNHRCCKRNSLFTL